MRSVVYFDAGGGNVIGPVDAADEVVRVMEHALRSAGFDYTRRTFISWSPHDLGNSPRGPSRYKAVSKVYEMGEPVLKKRSGGDGT